MNRDGHYGIALLVYSPVGLALASLGEAPLAILGGLAMLGLTMIPDHDLYVPLVPHRGPTHTLLFALGVGGASGAIVFVGLRDGWLTWLPTTADPIMLVIGGAALGMISIVAHLLGDVLTPMGLRPFWPVSDYHISVGVTTAANPVSNTILLAAGLVTAGVATAVAIG